MRIDFDAIAETVQPNYYGGEKEVHVRAYADANNKILKGRLEPGASIGLHTHEGSCEMIYILQGTGKMLYDDTVEQLPTGSCHYCPRGHMHSLMNPGAEDLVFFSVIPQK